MYKFLFILALLFVFGGCVQQPRTPSSHTYSPYSLEALDARYRQGNN